MNNPRRSAVEGYKAEQGTFHVNNTDEKTISFVGLRVDSDAVIASIEIGGVDVKDAYIADASVALPANTLLKIKPNDLFFDKITLTSGSVTLIIK